MIRFQDLAPTRRRPVLHHALSSARYKLGLGLPQDRAHAARLLREARRLDAMCDWRTRSWRRALDTAATFALQEAEAARDEGDERLERIFDHIACVMERVADLEGRLS